MSRLFHGHQLCNHLLQSQAAVSSNSVLNVSLVLIAVSYICDTAGCWLQVLLLTSLLGTQQHR